MSTQMEHFPGIYD